MRRVVVTGCGVVTPLGVGRAYVWNQLINGKSGIIKNIVSLKDSFLQEADIPVKIAGKVPYGTSTGELCAEDHFSSLLLRRYSDSVIYGLIATKEAMLDSGWEIKSEEDSFRTSIYIGSGIGGFDNIQRTIMGLAQDPWRKVSPFWISENMVNALAGHVSIEYNVRGASLANATACSTSAHSIGEGARMIQMDDADVVIAGGAEAPIQLASILGFSAMRALSKNYNNTPTLASRPWDKERDGFVLSEGAGVLILEEYEHAKKRGAFIYGELIGYGLSSDAFKMVAPDTKGLGAFYAMQQSLKKAHILPNDVDYINAHATSTLIGDRIELQAIKRLFGDVPHPKVSSTKSATGHMLGATGAVEAFFALMALQNQICPPTLNLDHPDDAANGVNLVPHKAQSSSNRIVMTNSFGFGGSNVSLIFKKV